MKYPMGYALMIARAMVGMGRYGDCRNIELIVAHPDVIKGLTEEMERAGLEREGDARKYPPYAFMGVAILKDKTAMDPYLLYLDGNQVFL
jgi:hypothetical protein